MLGQNYEHLFNSNSPPTPPTPPSSSSKAGSPIYSHYLQSKVVRARERIDAEMGITNEGTNGTNV
jgi:mitochondrial import inner membrane translocase subunit TIM16